MNCLLNFLCFENILSIVVHTYKKIGKYSLIWLLKNDKLRQKIYYFSAIGDNCNFTTTMTNNILPKNARTNGQLQITWGGCKPPYLRLIMANIMSIISFKTFLILNWKRTEVNGRKEKHTATSIQWYHKELENL